MTRLSAAAASTGYYWALARRYYELKTTEGEGDSAEPTWNCSKLQDEITGNGFIHCIQVTRSVTKVIFLKILPNTWVT